MLTVRERSLPSGKAENLRRATFTYDKVGSTLGGVLPNGYGHIRRSRHIGAGTARFEQAARTLLGWDMHRRAGVRVQTSTDHVVHGTVAILSLGMGRLSLKAPVRVVHVVDEPRRKGFAYGTLPGHPESGEEAFVIELHQDGSIAFTITAFSRPATRLSRAGGPITGLIQSRVTNRYLNSV